MDFSFISESMGKTVRLERGGPDKLSGKLVAIMTDALAIQTEKEGVVYVNAQHIKTISEPVIPEIQVTRTPPEGVNEEEPLPPADQPPLIEAESFPDLLLQLKHRLVRVNHGGPNALQGVLIDIRPESVTILHDMKDYVHYPIYHIKSITWILNIVEDRKGQGQEAGQEQHKDGKGKDKR